MKASHRPCRPDVVLYDVLGDIVCGGFAMPLRKQRGYARLGGNPSTVSFLRVSQTDVVSGSYERLIVEAVTELEQTLVPPPSTLFINLFCIDDFLGTDAQGLHDLLADRTQETRDHSLAPKGLIRGRRVAASEPTPRL